MTNQTIATDQDDQNVVEFGDSPGRRLRVQRQARGLAVERIASQLHLRPETVEALEQDRFDLLPDPVFVAGYLRNYARLLALDPTPLIAAYQGQADLRHVAAARRTDRPEADGAGPRLLVRVISLALAAAVIGIVILWWHDRGGADVESAMGEAGAPTLEPEPMVEEMQPDELPAEPSNVAEQTAEEAPDRSAPDLPGPGSPAASLIFTLPEAGLEPIPELARPLVDSLPSDPTATPAAEAEAEAAPMATEAATRPPPPDADLDAEADTASQTPEATEPKGVLLEFTGPSWVEVQDADGVRLISGEMQAGEQRGITGRSPFRFTIGRVSNTRMTVDGEPFDLLGNSKGDVARFTLDPESHE
ncbi:MAG: DUF4115 domain-containing protein [Thiocapsa sp.]|nr:RodZ domain-containing protein [Thiocapsa sp.]MCG6897167.1 DUF4115 domain-containing protein [Thiocapsa sp.]MCG6986138.1 DUF4115 domain-containing protein [Thiocapsa sp.]